MLLPLFETVATEVFELVTSKFRLVASAGEGTNFNVAFLPFSNVRDDVEREMPVRG